MEDLIIYISLYHNEVSSLIGLSSSRDRIKRRTCFCPNLNVNQGNDDDHDDHGIDEPYKIIIDQNKFTIRNNISDKLHLTFSHLNSYHLLFLLLSTQMELNLLKVPSWRAHLYLLLLIIIQHDGRGQTVHIKKLILNQNTIIIISF
jgi:hypothetical protein